MKIWFPNSMHPIYAFVGYFLAVFIDFHYFSSLNHKFMTHGWEAMNHTIFFRPKRGGLYVVIRPKIILSSPCTGM